MVNQGFYEQGGKSMTYRQAMKKIIKLVNQRCEEIANIHHLDIQDVRKVFIDNFTNEEIFVEKHDTN